MTPHLTTAITPILILLAVTLGYGVRCWLTPFLPCRRCTGTGRRTTGIRRTVRLCRSCKGTGLRLRAGRWIYNQLHRLHSEGTR